MAEVIVKQRVRVKIKDKSYDLKTSGNPHKDLPKDVVKFLQEGGYLADDTASAVKAATATNTAELSAAQAEVSRLTAENKTLVEENATLKEAKEAAEAELATLKEGK